METQSSLPPNLHQTIQWLNHCNAPKKWTLEKMTGKLEPLQRKPGTCAMLSVSGRQVQQVRAIGGQQGVWPKVSTKTSGGQNHRTKLLHLLSGLAVHTSHHRAPILHQLEDLCLCDDPGAGGLFGHFLQHLDQGLNWRSFLRPFGGEPHNVPPGGATKKHKAPKKDLRVQCLVQFSIRQPAY